MLDLVNHCFEEICSKNKKKWREGFTLSNPSIAGETFPWNTI
jgi:hypothetical protein